VRAASPLNLCCHAYKTSIKEEISKIVTKILIVLKILACLSSGISFWIQRESVSLLIKKRMRKAKRTNTNKMEIIEESLLINLFILNTITNIQGKR
jgi:hypothetical protein